MFNTLCYNGSVLFRKFFYTKQTESEKIKLAEIKVDYLIKNHLLEVRRLIKKYGIIPSEKDYKRHHEDCLNKLITSLSQHQTS